MTDDPPPLMVVAAAALLGEDGRVLLRRRPAGEPLAGLWEFPGGKLERGEGAEAALVRELTEELGVAVDAGACEPVAFATGTAGARPLLLLLYLVREWHGAPAATDGATLCWTDLAALPALAMPPADVPLAAALARRLATPPG